jgi:hypothetical protein
MSPTKLGWDISFLHKGQFINPKVILAEGHRRDSFSPIHLAWQRMKTSMTKGNEKYEPRTILSIELKKQCKRPQQWVNLRWPWKKCPQPSCIVGACPSPSTKHMLQYSSLVTLIPDATCAGQSSLRQTKCARSPAMPPQAWPQGSFASQLMARLAIQSGELHTSKTLSGEGAAEMKDEEDEGAAGAEAAAAAAEEAFAPESMFIKLPMIPPEPFSGAPATGEATGIATGARGLNVFAAVRPTSQKRQCADFW